MIRVEKVERSDKGRAFRVQQQVNNVFLVWACGNNKPVEVDSWTNSQIFDRAQLEIPAKLYNAARRQAQAILFPRLLSRPRKPSQLSLL